MGNAEMIDEILSEMKGLRAEIERVCNQNVRLAKTDKIACELVSYLLRNYSDDRFDATTRELLAAFSEAAWDEMVVWDVEEEEVANRL